MADKRHALFFGYGFTAHRLARRLLDSGWRVSGTVRDTQKPRSTYDGQVKLHLFDGQDHLLDRDVFADITHVVLSIPPTAAGDPALLSHGEDLRTAPEMRWIAYLSTPAVYGDRRGGYVSEETPPNPGSARGHRRLAAEKAWIDAFADTDISVQVFRLSGIYGPGRSPIDQLRAGSARIIEKPGQVFNRIHVDDIGSILVASMERPHKGRIYNVADDEACASGDVMRYAAALLGTAAPTPVDFEKADLSPMARSFYAECKRLDTTRLKEELGVTLAYPTYREGLCAILKDSDAPENTSKN
ncbi:SDR family oxidoreductase [Nisaea sp.]|uniref:SDR family oxidoreductase n=1 Tax=Nisaea sp. TaxID=2024842 RepID=UPI003B520B6F